MKVRLHYFVRGFDGEMSEIEEVRPEELPQLVKYWESKSCANVRDWEIIGSCVSANAP